MKLEPFTPAAVAPKVMDPITGEVFPPRASTTAEQILEAVEYAVRQMAAARVWVGDVEVHWSRGPVTIMHVQGHAEHVGKELVGVIDSLTEVHLDGSPVVSTPADRLSRLVLELEAAELDGLT